MSTYGARSIHSFGSIRPSGFYREMLDQPLGVLSTIGLAARDDFFLSFGAGTAIRELSLPPRHLTPSEQSTEANLRLVPGVGAVLGARDLIQGQASTPALTEEEYQTSDYFRDSVPFDPGMTEERAAALAIMADERSVNEYYRSQQPLASFVGGFLGQAVDPINYVPIAGPTVRAASIARFGLLRGSVAVGAMDAAANTAIFSVLTAKTRERFGDDVSFEMVITEIATAAAIGSVIGGVGGIFARRAEQRALQSAADQVATLQQVQQARIALNEGVSSLVTQGEVRIGPNGLAAIDTATQGVSGRISPVSRSLNDLTKTGPIYRDVYDLTNRYAQDSEAVLAELNEVRQAGIEVEQRILKRHGAQSLDQIDRTALSNEEREFLFNSFGPHKEATHQKLEGMLKPVADEGELIKEMAAVSHILPETADLVGMADNQRFAIGRLIFLGGEMDRLKIEPAKIASRTTGHLEGGRLMEKLDLFKQAASEAPARSASVQANGFDPTKPVPSEAEQLADRNVGKAESIESFALQQRVNGKDGSFPEQADLDQLQAEGALNEDDLADIAQAQTAYEDADAYSKMLDAAARCVK